MEKPVDNDMSEDKPNLLASKTSLRVFSSFTRRNTNNELTFENIISKECFNTWVQTRKYGLKNPKGSFRRAIYAHLRGADGRAPFPEDVEISILSKLREVSSGGKPVDPFSPILGNRKKFKRDRKGGWLPAFPYPYGHHEKRKANMQNRSQSLSRVRSKRGKFDNLSSVESLLNLSESEMKLFLLQGKQVSCHFSFPAVAYLINAMSSRSYFLSRDFIIPSPEEQFFRKEFPVMQILDGKFVYMDTNFQNIFGTSTNILQVVPSITEFFNARKEITPALRKDGSTWFRGTAIINGVRFVYKAFARCLSTNVENGFYQIELDNQVTDQALDRMLL
eukprot:snap_masked-scaffold_8-processed-gene-9.41-mRNA-1 protein AED:1.00 eAED:1.00 QI:0/0/0/0/1/1/5/0/333